MSPGAFIYDRNSTARRLYIIYLRVYIYLYGARTGGSSRDLYTLLYSRLKFPARARSGRAVVNATGVLKPPCLLVSIFYSSVFPTKALYGRPRVMKRLNSTAAKISPVVYCHYCYYYYYQESRCSSTHFSFSVSHSLAVYVALSLSFWPLLLYTVFFSPRLQSPQALCLV